MDSDRLAKASKFKIVVQWDAEDKTFLAVAPKIGDCSLRSKDMILAVTLLKDAIARHIEELEKTGQKSPVPLSERAYSGKLFIRIDPDFHREVALKAAAEDVSINTYVINKLRKD